MSRARDLADGTFSGAFSADSPTLVVDAANNKVGIGTSTTTGFDSSADSLIVGSGSASTGMTIYSGTSGYGSLHFADANSSPANYVGYVNYNHSTNSMQFATNNVEAARFNSSGNLVFPNGQGIDFSASAGSGASSSLLHDYEEGTWTPTTGYGSVSVTNARYTKIGNLVTVYALLQNFTDRTSGVGITVSGLPFTSASDSYHVGSTMHRYINAGGDSVMTYVTANQSDMYFYATINNASYVQVQHLHLSNSASLFFVTAQYRTS